VQTLTFTNPGEIDPRAMVTFGVNVKESDSPIGFFGTGLKYAIAGVLRLGGEIEVWAGETRFEFFSVPEEIRGKEFRTVQMQHGSVRERLGFTLDLGKHWEPWMIYRELYSNTLDEGGEVALTRGRPRPGHTTIIVECAALAAVHGAKAEFFLTRSAPPLYHNTLLEIHAGQSRWLYYKGIAVEKLAEPALYTYNFLANLELTEDRTVKDLWSARNRIMVAVANMPDAGVIEQVISAPEKSLEARLDFGYHFGQPGEAFIQRVVQLSNRTGGATGNKSAYKLAQNHSVKIFKPRVVPADAIQAQQLDKAIAFCKALGFDVTEHPIQLTNELQDDVLALAVDGTCWLSVRLFHQGTKQVASALLEEHLHLASGLSDESLAMQNFLFDLICSLGERLLGEPL
jgi:hypothetical protein